jgi:glycosyltransferase involved in cell wall biosynthesis
MPMKNMKVIFITREGYDLAGARIRCYKFARHLKKYGIDTKVFSFADNLGAKCGEHEQEMPLSVKMRYSLSALRRLLKEDKGTIFFLQRFNYHALAPFLVSLIRKNKIIFDCDDWNIREDPRYYWIFPSSKMEYATRKITGYSKACIVSSIFLENYLSPFNKNIYYCPTGADTEIFYPRPREDNGRIVFSWAGTIFHPEMRDNVWFIIDCFSAIAEEYSNIYLDIAGQGSYYEEIKNNISALEFASRINMNPWVNPDNMPEYLNNVDIGLLPLTQNSRFNNCKSPTKLFEYMAMGKPVIASAVGEANHIIKNGKNGFLCSGKQCFIDNMRALIENKTLRKNLGNQARQDVVRLYSLDVLARQLADILLSLDKT